MEQAVISIDGQTFGKTYVPDAFTEKFAESIVWECMLICEDVMKKDNSALGCWSEIKRKFRS
jgi:hypothetical protein